MQAKEHSPYEGRLVRLERWEIRTINEAVFVDIDPASVDDQLYFLRRLRDHAGLNLALPPLQVRYHGCPRG